MIESRRPALSRAPFRLRPIAGLRLVAGGSLGWFVIQALAAPELPVAPRVLAAAVFVAALWRPEWSLLAAIAIAPAGLLLAPIPASAVELVAWAFLFGWLIAIWRPLGAGTGPASITRNAFVAALAIYGACVFASWLGVTVATAGGVRIRELLGFVVRSVPTDHLIFSSPEAETWSALHAITGVAMLAAAHTLSRREARLVGWIAATLVASIAALGLLTVADVLRQWAEVDYGGWYLARYLRGERFSYHLKDLNAAGSLYVLAGVTAAALALGGRFRWPARATVVAMLPGLWLSGSRSAVLGGIVVGLAVVAAARAAQKPAAARGVLARPAVLVGGSILAMLLAIGVLSTAPNANERGGAGMSLRLRTEFLQTSGRMFASAPAFGVGIGHYYPESKAFMSPLLRGIYPNGENAHNFVVQEWVELGVVGGIAFVGLIVIGLRRGWHTALVRGDAAASGLFAGCVAYLLTCLTGHPLLVPEAAVPFWAAFGALAGAVTVGEPSRERLRVVLIAAAVVLLIGVGLQVVEYRRAPLGVERGFHDQRTSADGRTYRWSSRHAVAWTAPDIGFLVVPLRAPDFLDRSRPFEVQIEVDGAVASRVVPATNGWTRLTLPIRRRASGTRHRVDLRVNQVWTPMRDVDPGDKDDRPMGVMVGDIVLESAGR